MSVIDRSFLDLEIRRDGYPGRPILGFERKHFIGIFLAAEDDLDPRFGQTRFDSERGELAGVRQIVAFDEIAGEQAVGQARWVAFVRGKTHQAMRRQGIRRPQYARVVEGNAIAAAGSRYLGVKRLRALPASKLRRAIRPTVESCFWHCRI